MTRQYDDAPQPVLDIVTAMITTREHLQGVNESYFEHQRHAAGYGWRLLRAGVACFVHAIVPSRCVSTASDEVLRLSDELRARRGESACTSTRTLTL